MRKWLVLHRYALEQRRRFNVLSVNNTQQNPIIHLNKDKCLWLSVIFVFCPLKNDEYKYFNVCKLTHRGFKRTFICSSSVHNTHTAQWDPSFPSVHKRLSRLSPSSNSQYIIIWMVTNSYKPSSFPLHPRSFYSSIGQLVAADHLDVSHRRVYKPFLASTSSRVSQERLLSTPLPVCINIYQPGKQRQMSTMRQFIRVVWWRAHSCTGLKCNPSIRFVVVKHFVQL